MSDLLNQAIEAHGGLERWRGVRAVDVVFNFYGDLLDLKGYPGHHQPVVTVDAQKPKAVLQRLSGDPDDRWIFTPDRVWMERRDGEIIEERFQPRAAFTGHKRETPWDRLHLTYFIGYAMWNYLTAPFLLAGDGFITRELESYSERGEIWRVLEVTYPDHIPAHTKVQKLYFDRSFILKRLDYTTDVLGGVAAHYCYDPMEFDGILIPTFRRVVKRTPEGPLISGRTSFNLDYVNVTVRR